MFHTDNQVEFKEILRKFSDATYENKKQRELA